MSDEVNITLKPRRISTGAVYALLAAALFGVSTPFAKLLLGKIPSVTLAGVLYLGSGVGLGLWLLLSKSFVRVRRSQEAPLRRADLPWLSVAIFTGGLLGPVLLMFGLARTAASTASLLLNLEGALTACVAWFVFRENVDRRIALGMAAIGLGGLILSWSGKPDLGSLSGSLAIIGACLCWAIDNNFTRKVSAADPIQIAAWKGIVAGVVNCAIGLWLGAHLLPFKPVIVAGVVGFLGYGVSLVLFILALRHIGTARTGAYFSTAPFIGAVVAIILFREALNGWFIAAAALMGVGVWLHLTERHEHRHEHEPMEHEHLHVHHEHHHHKHKPGIDLTEPHSPIHKHEALVHSHAHYPDIHHRHEH